MSEDRNCRKSRQVLVDVWPSKMLTRHRVKCQLRCSVRLLFPSSLNCFSMCGVKQWSTAKCKKEAKTPAGERESFPGRKTASLTKDALSTTTGTRKMVAGYSTQ